MASRQPRRMQGERRVITMLFCDVTGSTAMAEQLDPEEWAEVMNEAFEYMVAPIYRYEGTVARLMGDGFLAFFGAPVSHEDDPQRAVMAGLDIIEDLAFFRQEFQEDYGLDFNVRVGINTGPVVVGEVGTDRALEYTAMGDAINLASRMEQSAAPGTIQISSYTFRLVAPLFETKSLGPIPIKGKEEPVEAYRVLSRKEQPGRLRGIEGLEAPLIGRAGEMEQLREVLDNLQNGQGGIVFLTGEAGLGKSRLINEVRAEWLAANPDPNQWTESQGLAYEMSRPYSLFHGRMLNNFDIKLNDSLEVMRQKLDKGIASFPAEHGAALRQAVETLLAIDAGTDGPRLEAEALKRRLFEGVYQFWYEAAARKPSVTVFDDLQWADPASVELINHLLPLVNEVGVLILCAMRPHHDSDGWQVREMATQRFADKTTEIDLSPLSNDESDTLVSSLLTIADLPDGMRELIMQKSEGNPFFVEEVVRTLIDVGAIERDESGQQWRATTVQEISIPDTLQALLTSRIDRLEKQTKLTIQLASVIGRSFTYRVLQQLADPVEELARELETLQQIELILEAAEVPDLEYIFRHELTREATYGTILRRQRRRYHRQVGEVIEALFPDHLADEADRLAYHFGEAGDKKRALKYYTIAGDRAAKLYANDEALAHYGQAISYALEIGTGEEIVHLFMSRGRTFEVSGRYDEALANYRELEELAHEREEPLLELEALVAQATLHSTLTDKFDPIRATELSEKALILARQLGNHKSEAKIYWNMMLVSTFSDRNLVISIEHGERSLAIAREYDLQEQMAYTLHDLFRPYSTNGQIELSYSVLEEAGELFRELGNMPMLADNRTSLAMLLWSIGKTDEALLAGREALELSREIHSQWGEAYSLSITAPIYFVLGHIDKAIDHWEIGLETAEAANFSGPQVYSRSYLALTYGLLGDFDRAISILEQLLDASDEEDPRPDVIDPYLTLVLVQVLQAEFDKANQTLAIIKKVEDLQSVGSLIFPVSAYAEAGIAMASGDSQRALSVTSEMLELMNASGMKFFQPSIRWAQANALLALGKVDEAIDVLREGQRIAEEMSSRIELWPVLISLAKVLEDKGEAAEALRLRAEARKVINFISEHISDMELRNRFLNLPEIREIIA